MLSCSLIGILNLLKVDKIKNPPVSISHSKIPKDHQKYVN